MRKIPNTFGIDVTAARFLEYGSEDELQELIAAGQVVAPWLHIGGGSNLLFIKDYEGTVLHSRIGGLEVTSEDEEHVSVRVGAGVVWDDFVAYCVERHWYGAENLSLIPGEVGASAVQNIGAYGVEVKDLITSVETINMAREKRIYGVDECGYSYRKSLFKQPEMKTVFVTYVNFCLGKREHYTLDYGTIRQELEKYPVLNLETLRRVIIDIRQSKLPDPKVLGNAGSFFKNPVVSEEQAARLLARWPDMPRYGAGEGFVKLAAGWLIDRCGWKGRRMGPVGVHDRQALVLVHYGGGTGADVMRLARAVQRDVAERFGVRIDMEVNLL